MGLELRQTPSQRMNEQGVKLRDRHLQVLQLAAKGMADKQIAQDLQISQETVHYHKKNLFRLLSVDNTAQALVAALQVGLLSLEEL